MTATGVILEYRGETLVIDTLDGAPINISNWPLAWLINIDRPPQGTFDAPSTQTGGNSGDILIGGDGPNRLFARDGDDVLRGGAAADFFDGGSGDDLVDYSLSEFAIIVDLGSDGPGDLVWQAMECYDALSDPPRPTIRWFPQDDSEPPEELLDKGDEPDEFDESFEEAFEDDFNEFDEDFPDNAELDDDEIGGDEVGGDDDEIGDSPDKF